MNRPFSLSTLVVATSVLAWTLSACSNDAGTDIDTSNEADTSSLSDVGPAGDAASDAVGTAPLEPRGYRGKLPAISQQATPF